MPLNFTRVFDERRHPGGRILTVFDLRIDIAYAAPWTVTPGNVGLRQRISAMHVQPRNSYMVFDAQPAPNGLDYHVYAIGPHNSGGTGGHQLTSGSTALAGQVLRVFCLGD